jgi:hypothetical protein
MNGVGEYFGRDECVLVLLFVLLLLLFRLFDRNEYVLDTTCDNAIPDDIYNKEDNMLYVVCCMYIHTVIIYIIILI